MFAISPTDNDWFKLLRKEGLNSEINFWTPTPWNISRLSSGDKLYFMLKKPIRKIGGYGEFVEYKNMNVDKAWSKFGLRNGCNSKEDLINRLNKYKTLHSSDERDVVESEIGCIILTNSVFYDNDKFLDLNNYSIDFHKNIVKIKYFEEEDLLVVGMSSVSNEFELIPSSIKKDKKIRLVTERKGQGVFKGIISEAYSNSCCITNETIPELLEAAHIQPYINEKSNHVKNGLLLRIDLHKLYDNGLIYIDKDFKVYVSQLVKWDYYQSLHGMSIRLPKDKSKYPSIAALEVRKSEFRNE